MNLDQQIMDLRQNVGEKAMYERKLNEAQVEYRAVCKKEAELKAILLKEKKDVHKLESVSLLKMWYSIFGNKSEKLEKEKAELSRAEYKYKITKASLDDLKEEIENLKHKLSTIKNNEKILKRLYEQKERDLLSLAGENSKKIKEINEKLDRLNSDAIELQEAVVAGKHLAMGLRNSLVNLEKASRLGTWDMFGGGFFIDMMKHSHIDQAKRNLEDLKYLSDRFTRELKDVNITLDMNINISGFLSFSDWFFDGFFVDMFVKKRIDEARVKLEEQIRQVEAVLEDIKNKHDKGMSEISHLNETKMNLLF